MLARESINTTFHSGCINTISFLRDGELLATAGDDLQVAIWDAKRTYKIKCHADTGHRRNIFSLRPVGENKMVTCGADRSVRVHAFTESGVVPGTCVFKCTQGQVKRVATSPREPAIIVSAGDDGVVRLYDLREKNSCTETACNHEVATFYQNEQMFSICMAQERPELLGISGDQPFVWLLDRRRMPSVVPQVAQFMPQTEQDMTHGVSSVALDKFGRRLVGSWFTGGIHLFDTNQGISEFSESLESLEQSSPASYASETSGVSTQQIRDFYGHLNAATVKDVQFVGPHETHVASGSDCGSFFVWNASSSELAFVGKDADSDVVNCVISHPRDCALVTCGIDNDFKLWTPTNRRNPQNPQHDQNIIQLIDENRETGDETEQMEVIERVFTQLRTQPECPLQ